MDKELQSELRILVMQLLGMPNGSVRPSDENQPTEGENYAILKVKEMRPVGWSGDSAGAYQSGVASIVIDFMGDESAHYARNIAIAMKSIYATNYLMGMNMGFLSCGPARNLSAIEMERVKRHQVVITLSYAFSYDMPDGITDDYGNIENIDISFRVEP